RRGARSHRADAARSPRGEQGPPRGEQRATKGDYRTARATTGQHGATTGQHGPPRVQPTSAPRGYDLRHVTRPRASHSAAAPQAAKTGPRRGCAVFVAQPAATVLW